MLKQYRVTGKGLNFKIHNTRCISNEIVELNDNDHIVQAHVACKAIEEVETRKQATPTYSKVGSTKMKE